MFPGQFLQSYASLHVLSQYAKIKKLSWSYSSFFNGLWLLILITVPVAMKKYKNFIKVGLSPSKNNLYLLQWKAFKNAEKCFLFHLKSFSRSHDIYFFLLTFWSCRQDALIRKIRLISKFITSQPG